MIKWYLFQGQKDGSVQFSRSVVSNSLQPRELQQAWPPCHHQLPEFTETLIRRVSDAIQPSHPWSSPSPRVPNPSQYQSLFQWVNSSWGGQSTGVSALASFLSKNTQDWSPLGWTGWISLQSKGLSRVFSNTTVQKPSILRRSAFFTVQLSHPYRTTGKTIALTRWTFVGKVMSLLLNMLSRLVITFLPRSKCILISWLRSVLGVHWKDWCWSWNSSTLATWCKELTHLKRPWCWEKGMTEDEMVGWHHRLNGHESE